MARSPRHIRLGPLLGSGGYGEVYLARRRTSAGIESPVAVKVLHASESSGAEDRLRDEAQLLFGLQHSVVVQALDLVWIDGRPALVTEYVAGLDLEQCYAQSLVPPVRALLEMGISVASALETAFRGMDGPGRPTRIVHRDIKPSNIRIGVHGEVRLLDFGIAMFADGDRLANTRTDVVVGSAPYMAPERFVSRESTPAIDIFGLGCCLYEGLATERFHTGSLRDITHRSTASDPFDRHHAERMERLEDRDPRVVSLVASMLHFLPDERPSPTYLVDTLDALANQTDGPTLKQWCADLDWPAPAPVDGHLSGREIIGSGRGSSAPTPPPPPVRKLDYSRPRVVREAPITRDPAMEPTEQAPLPEDDVPTVAAARKRPPNAPVQPPPLGCLVALALTIALTSSGIAVAVLRWLN